VLERLEMVTHSDVQAATARTSGSIRRTPLVEADPSMFPPTSRAWLKLEYLQHTGSFKARGALNRVLAAADTGRLPEVGVVAASGGNAGLAVAYAATRLGVPAEVYVPRRAPEVKVAKLLSLGATVERVGDNYADACAAAIERADDTGGLFCHAYDQPDMVAGHGSLGLELLDQAGGEVDTILLAVGGGGLMAGVAVATEGRARLVGVEPAAAPTFHAALEAGAPVDVEVSGVAADSLGAGRLGDIAYAVAVRTGVRSVLVDEAAIIEARAFLWDRFRVVVEHGAAAPAAALLSGAYRPEPGERVAVVLCGANTDPSDL
jgi:threonine dehydratase